jgi:hypothetical protein
MVVIDATMLLLFLHPGAPGPSDAAGNPLKHARQRVEHLIAELEKSGEKVAIPTPALSEVLVKMGKAEAQRVVEILNRRSVFSIEPFDQRAAIELAVMLGQELGGKPPKEGRETWAKLKFDRQIVAIAKVCRASAMYSDDDGLHALGEKVKIPAYRVRDLPLPPGAGQGDLFEPDED